MRKPIILAIVMATAILAGAGTLTEKESAIVDLGAAAARGEQDKGEMELEREGDVLPAVDFPALENVFIRRED